MIDLAARDRDILALWEKLRSPYIGLTRRAALEALAVQHMMTPERVEQIVKATRHRPSTTPEPAA